MQRLPVALFLACVLATPAHPCDVLPDQSYEGPMKDGGFFLTEDDTGAQSFTPSITGILDLVSVYMFHGASAIFTASIHAAESGLPVGPALASSVVELPPSGEVYFEEWVVFDFYPEQFHVTAGETIAVVLSVEFLPPYPVLAPIVGVSPFGDPYPGGIFSSSSLGEPWFPSPDFDMLFRTTVCVGSVAVESESWGSLKALYR